MKNRRVLCVILIVIIQLSVGCTNGNNETNDFIAYDYSGINYYVTDEDYNFPLLVGSKKIITQAEIVSINETELHVIDVSYQFIIEEQNGVQVEIGDYYVYGFILNLSNCDCEYIETLEIKFDDKIYSIPVNINVVKIDVNNGTHILPKSIPMDYNSNYDFVFELISTDRLLIKDVELLSSTMSMKSLKINNLEMSSEYETYKDELLILKIELENVNNSDSDTFDKVYIKINYEIDGVDYIYISPYTVFGSLEKSLSELIVGE